MRLLFLCSLMVLAACRSELETVETTDEDGYQIQYTRSKTDYAKQGKYISYFPDGTVYEEAEYLNDTLHGSRKLYYENGKLSVVENYKRGKFISPFLKYFESGEVQIEGSYENNKASGIWKRYYKNGQLMEVVNLRDNEEYGPFEEYYENGKKKAEGEYAGTDEDTGKPLEQGVLKLYNEQGELIKEMNCNRGTCLTTWKKEE